MPLEQTEAREVQEDVVAAVVGGERVSRPAARKVRVRSSHHITIDGYIPSNGDASFFLHHDLQRTPRPLRTHTHTRARASQAHAGSHITYQSPEQSNEAIECVGACSDVAVHRHVCRVQARRHVPASHRQRSRALCSITNAAHDTQRIHKAHVPNYKHKMRPVKELELLSPKETHCGDYEPDASN
jgi:hypothetical protein